MALNDSLSVKDVSADTGLLRNLPRDAMIGKPWLDLVKDSDQAVAREALLAPKRIRAVPTALTWRFWRAQKKNRCRFLVG
ncbi:MAG: hypothetical protein CM15mP74_31480 [Halieaceae bacterium]|nr:MAG: hypothetical protein CM15mP74_31480 [Halieaceae bacterium]